MVRTKKNEKVEGFARDWELPECYWKNSERIQTSKQRELCLSEFQAHIQATI